MASYDASINLIVSGTTKIDKIINKAAQLESIVNDINKKPLEVNVAKVTSAFDTLESNLKASRSTLLSQQKAADQAAGSIDSYTDQIVDLQRKLAGLNPNTKKYNDLLDRQNQAIRGRAAAEKEANASLERVAKTQAKIAGLEKDTARAKAAKESAIAVENLADSYLRLGTAQQKSINESSIASLGAQAEALKLVANNSQVASSQFNRFAIATQAASQKIFEARQKQLGALAFGLSPEAPRVNVGKGGAGSIAGARGLVGSLIASGSEVVKSEAALSDYAERLRALQSLVPYTSNEFRALEEAIAGVNQEISQIGLRGQKSAIQALSGPATDLGTTKAVQLRESFQKKVNDQLNLQDKIQERISQATLFDFQKKKLTLQLDEAVAALAENRLGDAQRLTREIDRQRISMERMNRAAQKPQVFGALGTAFMPVTGELPGGNVPGSPAAKAAEAKANRESTQAAVALAKQKQKAIEDEAEELRKGTQAATALGKQKLKALQDEAERLRQETSNAVALAQQKMREEERVIAQAWKMRGGPALPPSMGGGTAGVRGQAFRAGGPGAATAALSAPRRVESLVRSAQLAQEKLLELEIRGVDVTGEKASVQKIINSLKEKDLQISDQLLNNADDELNLIRDVLRLEKQRLTNQRLLGGGGAGAKAGATGTGLEQALKNLQEARGARQAFFGGASPAQAIDQIVREFNKGQPAQNVTGTFADGLLGGSKEIATAATTAFTAALEAIKKVFGIASPSRVMKEIASNLISSFITELVSNIPSVKAALEQTFTAKDVDFEQPGRGLPRRAPLAAQIDPGYLAALTGAPLTPGRPSSAGIFPAPAARVGAPGSAFPFQTYDMSFPQFPVEAAAQLKPPSSLKNRPGDTSRILSAAIKEYRAAVDNFWEGEDSQFEAIKKIVVSSGRLAAAQLARRLQQAKDLTPDQQFQQTASEARSLLSAGRQSGVSRFAGAANDLITGERRLGVSEAVGNILQRISDSVLNSIEALGFSVSNSFEDGIDRIRSGVPNAISRGLSSISGGFGGGPSGGGGAGGGGAAGGGGSVSQVAQLLGFDAIADISRVSTRELEALSAAASELRAVLDPTIEGFDRLDNQLRETIGQIGRQIERRAPEAGFLTRQFGPRTARGLSEGLIGGAFPLLFGQGVGAAVGGGAGGFAGGFAGGGLGFGLSLVGTALGTAFDQLSQAAQEAGQSLRYPIEGFEKLKEANLFASREQEYYISKLIESGRATEAAGVIQTEIIKKIGVTGVNDLTRLGESSTKLSKAWAEFNLQLQAAIAGPLAGILNWLADVINIGNDINAEAARQQDILSGLSSQDRRTLQAEEQRILSGVNLFNEAQKRQQVAQLYGRFEPKSNISASGVKLTPEQIDAQKKAKGVTKELQAQVELQMKQLSLTGLTLERDGARYINAAKAVAIQEYDNKLLEIKNSWIGKAITKEEKLAQLRGAQLDRDIRLKQIDVETTLRQEQLTRNILQAELALYQQRQETINLIVRIAEFQEGEEAGLRKQISLADNLYSQKLAAFLVEEEIALTEARRNGTLKETLALYKEKRKILDQEHVLEEGITGQKLAQLQLNKFIATEEAKRQAADPFIQFRQSQQLDQQYAKTYHRLLVEGIMPAEAERRAGFEKLVGERMNAVNAEIAYTQVLLDQAIATKAGAGKIDEYRKSLEDLNKARGVISEQALQGPGPKVEKIRGRKIQDFASRAIEELRELETTAINVSQGIGNSIGNSITDGISGLIEGTAEAEQVFANFLKNIANILIQEGTRMIAMYTAIAIAKAIAGMANYNQSFNTNVPGAQAGSDFGIPGQIIPADAGIGSVAANGAYFANGVAAFAKGGMFTDSVVSSPTLFKFADGGAMKTGVMGEAGPEAIMPLSRNSDGRLGVDASGLREAMGGSSGSSSTPMLNMTFETTSINGVEYVSRDQLEAAMAATRRQATKDGAKQGMNMTLDRLQQSPKTRSRVGLR